MSDPTRQEQERARAVALEIERLCVADLEPLGREAIATAFAGQRDRYLQAIRDVRKQTHAHTHARQVLDALEFTIREQA